MSFIKQRRAYFFRENAPLNLEGKKINLQDNQRPDQDLFERFHASYLNFSEEGDRAKVSTGGAIENEVGTVAIAPDSFVLNYTSGIDAYSSTRTLVTHSGQLTEIDEETQNIPLTNDVPEYNDVIVEKNKDLLTTTRNKFIPRLKSTFLTWIQTHILPRLIPSGGTASQVLSKTDNTDYNVQWVDASSGEANTITNIGGALGQIFKQKTGSNLELRTLGSIDVYTTVNTVGDVVEIGTDIGQVLTYIQNNYVESFTSAQNIGGFTQIYKSNGDIIDFRTLQSSDSSVDVVQNVNDIDLKINNSFITNLIQTEINSVMNNSQLSAKSYLFSAKSNSNQLLTEGSKLIFADDVSEGYYDYDNCWTTSQFVANADLAIDQDLLFNLNVVLEYVKNATDTNDIDIELVHVDQGTATETVIATETIIINGTEVTGDKKYVYFIDVKPSDAAITMDENDKIFPRIVSTATTNTDLASGTFIQMNTGSLIYNSEL